MFSTSKMKALRHGDVLKSFKDKHYAITYSVTQLGQCLQNMPSYTGYVKYMNCETTSHETGRLNIFTQYIVHHHVSPAHIKFMESQEASFVCFSKSPTVSLNNMVTLSQLNYSNLQKSQPLFDQQVSIILSYCDNQLPPLECKTRLFSLNCSLFKI